MSEPRRPLRTSWAPLIGSLALVLFLATIGSFAAEFGVMTNCTNTYSCTITSCRPCSAASTWLNAGWAGQGALLLIGAALAVLGARPIHMRTVRLAAMLLGAMSVVLFVATTSLAVRSF